MVENPVVDAIILAAGRSVRMGRPKLSLPWGDTTIIGTILDVLMESTIDQILVVTGCYKDEIENAVKGYGVRTVFNPKYHQGEMLSSVKVGLRALNPGVEAALITLGDQPFIRVDVVTSILDEFKTNRSKLIIPSYEMQRGHPWLVDKALWAQILNLKGDQTLRDFLDDHQDLIKYIPVKTKTVLMDLDTPEDYQTYRPR